MLGRDRRQPERATGRKQARGTRRKPRPKAQRALVPRRWKERYAWVKSDHTTAIDSTVYTLSATPVVRRRPTELHSRRRGDS